MGIGPTKRTRRSSAESAGKVIAPQRWDVFFARLSETANVTKSSEAAGISRDRVYAMKGSDPAFKARFDEAYNVGYEKLQEECERRAFEGYDRAVYQGGSMVGIVREYSDALAMFLLKGQKPSRFRERTENLNVNANINTDDDKALLEKLRAKLLR